MSGHTLGRWVKLLKTACLLAALLPAIGAHAGVVYRANGTAVVKVAPTGTAGSPLPATLVIEPGTYTFDGASYDVSKGGLYRFLSPPSGDNEQRIVWTGDVPSLLSGLAWVISHGSSDNVLWREGGLQEAAMHRKVFLTCGSVAGWARIWLDSFGIENRIFSVIADPPFNSYDDGHWMIEVRDGDRWVLYDLTLNVVYLSQYGERLSGAEVVERVLNDDYLRLLPIAADTSQDAGNWVEGGYDYSLYGEMLFADPEQWVRRIFRNYTYW